MKLGGGTGDGDQPDWVPLPPGATVEGHFSMSVDSVQRGNLQIVTDLDADEVIAFYRRKMEAEGYEIHTSSFSGDNESVTILTGHEKGDGRSLTVNVSHGGAEYSVGLTYSEGE